MTDCWVNLEWLRVGVYGWGGRTGGVLADGGVAGVSGGTTVGWMEIRAAEKEVLVIGSAEYTVTNEPTLRSERDILTGPVWPNLLSSVSLVIFIV